MNDIDKILEGSRVIAVVGLSSREHRPSFRIAEYLKSVGYQIIPINPNETTVLGEKAYPTLDDVPVGIDVVDIFRRSEFVPPIVEAAIRVGAKVIWMQEGVVHEAAAQHARSAGLQVVMDRCILKEHRRWMTEKRATSAL